MMSIGVLITDQASPLVPAPWIQHQRFKNDYLSYNHSGPLYMQYDKCEVRVCCLLQPWQIIEEQDDEVYVVCDAR